MARPIKTLLATLVVSLSLAAPVLAGPWEDGKAAYKRGDHATALRLWRPLAEQGNANAQHYLGNMYANGHGVPQDYAEAVKWHRKAAEQGDATAQTALGVMYINGRGVPQDYVQAHKWYNLAASRFPPSTHRGLVVEDRENVAAKMTAAQIAEAQSLAREWMAAFEKRKKK